MLRALRYRRRSSVSPSVTRICAAVRRRASSASDQAWARAICPTAAAAWLVSSVSGRLDYIETIKQWRRRFAEPSWRKRLMKLRLVPRWLTSSDFRLAFTSGVSANSVCFERELLDHFRLVFEKAA